MSKIFEGFIIFAIVSLGCSAIDKSRPPQLDEEEWWGPESLKGKQDTSIRPFKVKFSDEMVKDLRQRLNNHRPFTPPLNGTNFEYGFNGYQLADWVKYWAEEYPFKEREDFFNQYPQYKTNIQGLDIQFIRVKPEVPAGIELVPILLLHGWPGSIREFYEIIPLLSKQVPGYDFAFEVIVPSLPGYGYSDGASKPGLGAPQMAVVFKNLMNRLGFKKYYIQGGDWGAYITSALTTLYPDEVLGQHSNYALVESMEAYYKMILGDFIPSMILDIHKPNHMKSLYSYFEFIMEEMGYLHIQATKPDTVGVGIADSPAGLLAYILEKIPTWTRRENRYLPDAGLSFRFTKDQLIDNLMMYWAPNCFTTAVRIYAEQLSRKNRELDLHAYTTPVPTWALQAKYEMYYQPPSILKLKYINLIGTTVMDDGGHHLAWELPQEFADDVFKAVNAFRDWHSRNNDLKHTEL